MIAWLDGQLPPALARWLTNRFGIVAFAIRELGLREASDREIFDAARQASATIISKDADFVALVQRFGPPPSLIWLTCGNVTNSRLQFVFESSFDRVKALLDSGIAIVELGDV